MEPIFLVSPFSKAYWRGAVRQLMSVRMLVVAALMVALRVALGSFFIPVGENLRMVFTFPATALGAFVYGPILAMLEGVAADLIGVMLYPTGPFFPGYTLSAALGSLIYALLLYQARVSVWRLAVSKTIVSVLVNIVLGSIWSAMLMGKGFLYYAAKSTIKNLALLPLEIVILCILFQALLPALTRLRLCPAQRRLYWAGRKK